MDSKYNKYELPSGIAIAIGLFSYFLFRNSASAGYIVIAILFALSLFMLLIGILTFIKKLPEAKFLIPAGLCFTFLTGVGFLNDYFERNGMEGKNITSLLMPVAFEIFIFAAFRHKWSNSTDKGEIISAVIKFILITIVVIAYEIDLMF